MTGKLHTAHRVNYSIGIVGRYLLHVRLRQAALPVPGSPFTLTVTRGTENAPPAPLAQPPFHSPPCDSPPFVARTAELARAASSAPPRMHRR